MKNASLECMITLNGRPISTACERILRPFIPNNLSLGRGPTELSLSQWQEIVRSHSAALRPRDFDILAGELRRLGLVGSQATNHASFTPAVLSDPSSRMAQLARAPAPSVNPTKARPESPASQTMNSSTETSSSVTNPRAEGSSFFTRALGSLSESARRYLGSAPERAAFQAHHLGASIIRGFIENYEASIPERSQPLHAAGIERAMLFEGLSDEIKNRLLFNREHPETLGRNRPIAVLFYSRNSADLQGALDHSSDMITGLMDTYDVVYREYTYDDEILPYLDQLNQKSGHPPRLVVFAGHGDQTSQAISEGRTAACSERNESDRRSLDITDLNGPLSSIGKTLDPQAQILLLSCSNGEGGSGSYNLANAFSTALPGLEIFAAPFISSGVRFHTERQRLSQVEFRNALFQWRNAYTARQG